MPLAHLEAQTPTKDLYFNIVQFTHCFTVNINTSVLFKKSKVIKIFYSVFLLKLYCFAFAIEIHVLGIYFGCGVSFSIERSS